MNRWFAKFAAREGLAPATLLEAVERAGAGLIDADLGGGLIKQRLAREGGGRSGGYRSLIVYRSGDRAVFAYGFAKSRMANLDAAELKTYRKAAGVLLGLSWAQIDLEVRSERMFEVKADDQDL